MSAREQAGESSTKGKEVQPYLSITFYFLQVGKREEFPMNALQLLSVGR